MEQLYIKTEKGKIPIEQSQIKKYNLRPGAISPGNRFHVVDKDGNEIKSENNKERKFTRRELMTDGQIFSASEVIDISQGVDASDGE